MRRFVARLSSPRPVTGFTLIELLIVVAIIAILAAIAVPNFLEAQIRSKASRVAADMRAASVAEEAYAVDNNTYTEKANGFNSTGAVKGWVQLTTPIPYITSWLTDPFPDTYSKTLGHQQPPYEFVTAYFGTSAAQVGQWPRQGYVFISVGPDKDDDTGTGTWPWSTQAMPYDPTNGTVSNGDIYRLSTPRHLSLFDAGVGVTPPY